MNITILGHERLHYCLKKGLTIEIELFELPEGFKSFAFTFDKNFEDLDGYGFHIDRDTSVLLAIKDLLTLMESSRD